jgi:hypothetical protein
MPKQERMAQLSRPFQIALVAVVLFAGVWLFALQGRSTSTSTGGSGSSAAVSTSAPATSTPAVTAKAQHSSSSKAAGATTRSGHGSGSSLGALSRPINLAHHAAAVSAQHEAQIAAKSAQASNEAPAQTASEPTHAPAASATAAAPATRAATKAATKAVVKTSTKTAVSPAHKSAAAPSTKSAASTLSGQRAVEADLAKGDVVVLLFWNPAGADDVAVHAALQPLASAHNRKIAVQYALASQVATFGSITRGVQVFATPTVLVIDKRGQTTVLTGVQDTFSIEQAIAEARSS